MSEALQTLARVQSVVLLQTQQLQKDIAMNRSGANMKMAAVFQMITPASDFDWAFSDDRWRLNCMRAAPLYFQLLLQCAHQCKVQAGFLPGIALKQFCC
jgi:hypothetical protein